MPMTTTTLSTSTTLQQKISGGNTLDTLNTGTVDVASGLAVYGLYNKGTGDSVINYGLLESGANIGGTGIGFYDGGTVVNHGTISAVYGVSISDLSPSDGGGASVTNYGTIASTPATGTAPSTAVKDFGVKLQNTTTSNYLRNAGHITASGNVTTAVVIDNADAGTNTIVNQASGVIQGGTGSGSGFVGRGVYIEAGGATITNAGTISGYHGIVVSGADTAAVTVTNAGTIKSPYSSVGALLFGGGDASLILDPGAKFNGYVLASSGTTNSITLETGASAGTVSGAIGPGGEYRNFQTVILADNADWTLSGAVASGETLVLGNAGVIGLGDTATNPTDFAGTLENLVAGNTIVLTNDAYSGTDTVSLGAGNVLDVSGAAGTLASLQLNPAQAYTASDFSLTNAGGNEAITSNIPCFARGTRLRTARGEIAVENLQRDDRIPTLDGALRPIIWLGRRRIDLTRHPRPEKVQPIRIKAGAIAEGVPARDLVVSPGHGIYLDGVLIPAGHLVNGVSVLREAASVVEYFHVELDEHAVLFSENCPSESYLDTGNRAAFEGTGMALHPDFSPRAPKAWQETCVPLVWDGPAWHAARGRLRARLIALGAVETEDPDLHLRLGGQRIEAATIEREGDFTIFAFPVPEPAKMLTLVSRVAVPGEILPDCADHRPLGVALHRLVFRGRGRAAEIPLASLRDGWHALEMSDAGHWRWSMGEGDIPLAWARPPHLAGAGRLLVTVRASGLRYLAAPGGSRARVAA